MYVMNAAKWVFQTMRWTRRNDALMFLQSLYIGINIFWANKFIYILKSVSCGSIMGGVNFENKKDCNNLDSYNFIGRFPHFILLQILIGFNIERITGTQQGMINKYFHTKLNDESLIKNFVIKRYRVSLLYRGWIGGSWK